MVHQGMVLAEGEPYTFPEGGDPSASSGGRSRWEPPACQGIVSADAVDDVALSARKRYFADRIILRKEQMSSCL